MTRLDSGCTPEQEAWIRGLTPRQRLGLLVLDVTVQVGFLGFLVWLIGQMPLGPK